MKKKIFYTCIIVYTYKNHRTTKQGSLSYCFRHGSGSNRQKDNIQTKGCRRIIWHALNKCCKEWDLLITDLESRLVHRLNSNCISLKKLIHCSTLPYKSGLLCFTSLKLPSVQIYRGYLVNHTLIGRPIGRAIQQAELAVI